MVMTGERKLQIEGRLRIIEMTGAWSVYTGERIVIGPGERFRDDLGIEIREMFEDGGSPFAPSGTQLGEARVRQAVGVDAERRASFGSRRSIGFFDASIRPSDADASILAASLTSSPSAVTSLRPVVVIHST
jgi:hypothetical protein